MSYQVMARRWRPQSFQSLKGQSLVRQNLLNALKAERLHHALLFTGPRGTGKTSMARIVAKALRCTQLKKDFTPCGQCQDCKDITAGRSLDVLEIDGASNNGVEAVRELREQVQFKPSSGTEKIYIIDEVHMLSISAFNALLKTLEEPPEHVRFILATTEIHKLPQTILSRCQRYNFKPVPLKEVVELLSEICKTEKIDFEEEALFAIAQAGEGCVRDALSFLEQSVTTFGSEKLTKNKIAGALGVLDVFHFENTIEFLIRRDPQKMVEQLQSLKSSHFEPQSYLEQLAEHFKNLAFFKASPEQMSKSAHLSEGQKSLYHHLAQKAEQEDLFILFDIVFKGVRDLAKSFDAFLTLEITLLKAVTAPYFAELEGAVAQTEPGVEVQKVKPKSGGALPLQKTPKVEVQESSVWTELVEKVKGLNPIIGAKLEICEHRYSESEQKLWLAVKGNNSFLEGQVRNKDFLDKVKNYISSFWGKEVEVLYHKKGEPLHAGSNMKPSAQDAKKQEHSEQLAKSKEAVENHPVIQAMTQKHNMKILEINSMEDKS